jgi:hypothetical protein
MSYRRDIAETLTNTVGGFFLAYLVALFVFPLIGVPTTAATAGTATLVMFVVSNIRAFAVRRVFRATERKE